MKTFKVHGKVDKNGHLKLDIPTHLESGDVEIVMIIEKKTGKPNRYDFSDLSGKLKWNGDAVLTQRLLRDEWE